MGEFLFADESWHRSGVVHAESRRVNFADDERLPRMSANMPIAADVSIGHVHLKVADIELACYPKTEPDAMRV